MNPEKADSRSVDEVARDFAVAQYRFPARLQWCPTDDVRLGGADTPQVGQRR